MKRTAEAILNDIQAAQAVAATDISSVPRKTQASFEIARREAVDSLPKLIAEYRARIFTQSRAFVPTGTPKQVQAYVGLAAQEGVSIVVDVQDLYKRLAAPVEAAIGSSREVTSNSVYGLEQAIAALALDLGLESPTRIKLTDVKVCKTAEETTAYVREHVRAVCGDVLNLTYMGAVITSKALESQFKGQLLPVIVLNAQDEDLLKVFRQVKLVPIAADADVTVELVTRSFKADKAK